MIHKRSICSACLLVLALAGTLQTATAADEEGESMGVIEAVDREAGIVVIDGQRYRTYGNRVQPPQGTHSESENYETRPFQRGMIVRYTVKPGNPPVIQRAWSIE